MDHNSGRACYETYISTQQPQAQAHAWLPSPYGNQERSAGPESTARQGSSTVDALTPSRELDDGALAPHAFSRHSRLTSAAEYGRVFARSQRSSDSLFTVLARGTEGTGPRLGLAISKRAAKRAVQRNRLKRVAREVFRLRSDLVSMDFIVLANTGAKKASLAELRSSLEKHFDRLARQSGPASHGK